LGSGASSWLKINDKDFPTDPVKIYYDDLLNFGGVKSAAAASRWEVL
jgi:hypothetical protein